MRRPVPVWVGVVATGALRAGAFFALWLVLIDEVELPDLLNGAVVALLAAALVAVLQRVSSVSVRLQLGMLRHVHRPLILLFTDSVRVLGALAASPFRPRTPRGRFRAVRYTATTEEPRDQARRVLTEWGASLGANRYVIGIDPDARLLIVHELVDAGGPLDPLELG